MKGTPRKVYSEQAEGHLALESKESVPPHQGRKHSVLSLFDETNLGSDPGSATHQLCDLGQVT